jgi:diguanylate cyclase (GGDEF)-like protein
MATKFQASTTQILENPTLEQRWRRVLLTGLPIGLFALIFGWLLEKTQGNLSPFDNLGYPFLGIVALLLWYIGAFQVRFLSSALLGTIASVGLYFVGKTIYLLFVLSPTSDIQNELTNMFCWTPVFYLLCFLVTGKHGGKRLAIHFTLSYVWIALIYAYAHHMQLTKTNLDLLGNLSQLNLSHFVQLIMGYSFTALKNHYNDSQNRLEVLGRSVHTDTLTGLPNRLCFQSTLENVLQEAQSKGSRVAVFFIDIDRFKLINDTLGHSAGDKLLEIIAQRLKLAIRSEDFVARISGDEFVVISKDLEKTNLIPLIAQRLLDVFSAPFEIYGHVLNVSASIGSSVFPDDAYEADMLLRHADSAMYSIKKQGKNGFMTYQQTDASLERRWQLEKDLKIALDEGQFKLYYQPIYNLHNGDLVKLEALVRWVHPVQGVVSPAEFISVAEESGQILVLGTWVIDEACRQAKSWNLQHVKVAVNVSALQFAHPNFVITVMNALKESNLSGYALELELTESIVMGHPEDVKQTMLDLKDLGIQLAIDDFGTGYSSLAYLRDLPIDTVKIDKTFIQDLDAKAEDEPFSHALVESITGLAKRLHLQVVAEGVENEAQCILLRRLGCQLGQGYHFSKPIPSEDVEVLLRHMLHRPTLMALPKVSNSEKLMRY